MRQTSSLALHEMRQQDVEDPGVTLDTGSTVLPPPHHVHGQQSLQTVVDCRSWPRLDVTMATRVQPSSTVQLGKHHADVIKTEDMRGKWTGSRYFFKHSYHKVLRRVTISRKIFFGHTFALCTDNRTRISKRKKHNKNNISTTEIRYRPSKKTRYRTQFKNSTIKSHFTTCGQETERSYSMMPGGGVCMALTKKNWFNCVAMRSMILLIFKCSLYN